MEQHQAAEDIKIKGVIRPSVSPWRVLLGWCVRRNVGYALALITEKVNELVFVFLMWVLRVVQEYFTYIEPIIHQR